METRWNFNIDNATKVIPIAESRLFAYEMLKMLNRLILQEDYITAMVIHSSIRDGVLDGRYPKEMMQDDHMVNLNFKI